MRGGDRQPIAGREPHDKVAIGSVTRAKQLDRPPFRSRANASMAASIFISFWERLIAI